MGTFEKLGILVIVIIIVMILAVAIYQWGGSGAEPSLAGFGGSGQPLVIERDIDQLGGSKTLDVPPSGDDEGEGTTEVVADGMWPGGIPQKYKIRAGDKVWLLPERWGLKIGFAKAIEKANPTLDMARLRPGQALTIPDPAPYRRDAAGAGTERAPSLRTRKYEVQIGDTFESIAMTHLGSKVLWTRIAEANPDVSPHRLRVGQVIDIPLN